MTEERTEPGFPTKSCVDMTGKHQCSDLCKPKLRELPIIPHQL